MTRFIFRNNATKRQWSNIFKVVKEKKKSEVRILYPAKILFKMKANVFRHFSFKLKEFISSIAALQEMLKEVPSERRKMASDRDMDLLEEM